MRTRHLKNEFAFCCNFQCKISGQKDAKTTTGRKEEVVLLLEPADQTAIRKFLHSETSRYRTRYYKYQAISSYLVLNIPLHIISRIYILHIGQNQRELVGASSNSARSCHWGWQRGVSPSIRRRRAAGVAKLACYPGCFRRRRPPPLSMFFESRLKKRRSRLHFGAFLHLEDFQCGESEFSRKSFILLVFWRFLGILGRSKNRQKNEGNSPKNHRSGKKVFRDGFWSIFGHFFQFSIRKRL